MTPIRNATALAGALTLVFGGSAMAQGQDGANAAKGLPPAQLELLSGICQVGGNLPDGLTCEDVAAALQDKDGGKDKSDQADADPAADPADALKPAQPAPPETADVPKAPEAAEPAETPEPEVAEPADTPEPEAPETADVPKDPAPEATEPPETADPGDVLVPEEPETPEPAPETAEAPRAPAPETQDPPEAAEAAPAPERRDPQAQVDALRRLLEGPPAAAAANPRDDGELVEEKVDEDDVRRSDEDFRTGLDGTVKPGAEARKDGDDDDGLEPWAKAALLGLGAVALSEILDEDDRVVSNSGDRVVVEQDGQFRVLRNDDVLLRRPGAEVETRRFDDGSTRTRVRYEDGSVVETIRAADGRVLRRVRSLPDGTEVVLFDDTEASPRVEVSELPRVTERNRIDYRDTSADSLARALAATGADGVNRSFSLAQVRNIDAVRHLVPEITVDTINFETNSAAIRPEEAQALAALGEAMRRAIAENPGEVFLIEGHTDAVGSFAYNLALSDRRAESVALALTEYFAVPPENLVLQGYGEGDLLVRTDEAERANRRAAVRRITPLLSAR
ncbi:MULTISPECIES: OmpA family protein [unclassified Mameliella]|uniref:OmpA family protein n=1 Tax=unclassified Mameliella TaxID=2630630 RepID=UPI00273EDAE2|nr:MULTISPECIES: OmpA family protein [unclassified Mameliella]